MRTWCWAVLCGILVTPLVGGEKTVSTRDQDRLQGPWEVVSVTYNGKDFFAKGQAKFEFIIKKDEIVVQGNDRVKAEYARMTFKLDPSTTPRCLDLRVTGGVQKDAALEGIYELKGEQLRLCIKVFGNERPAEFASPEGASIALLMLRKQK